jgi:hypothetical protein
MATAFNSPEIHAPDENTNEALLLNTGSQKAMIELGR